MTEIKRTVFETSRNDKAAVFTELPEGGLPGAGYCSLVIGGDNGDGEQEVLELRLRADFLPHITKLQEQLSELARSEEELRSGALEAAQALVDGKAEDMRPFEKASPKASPQARAVFLGGEDLSREELEALKKEIIADLLQERGLEEADIVFPQDRMEERQAMGSTDEEEPAEDQERTESPDEGQDIEEEEES